MPWIKLDRIRQQLPFDLDDDEEIVLKDILKSNLAYIKTRCRQALELGDYKEIAPSGKHSFQLNQRPVNYTLRVSTPIPVLAVACSNVRPLIRVDDNNLYLQSFNGDVVPTTIDFASYKTIQAVSDKIGTVNGWTCSVMSGMGAYPSDDLEAIGGHPGTRTQLYGYCHDIPYDQRGASIVLANPICFGQVQAKYNAGYATCPDDLQQLLAKMCAYEFAARNADMVYTSESLGGYSYSLNPQKAFESLGGWAEQILDNYRIDRVYSSNYVK